MTRVRARAKVKSFFGLVDRRDVLENPIARQVG